MDKIKRTKRIVFKSSLRSKLLFAILFIFVFILVGYVNTVINSRVDSGITFHEDTQTFDFAQDEISEDDQVIIGQNWIFVPNLTDDVFLTQDYEFDDYLDGIYASNVSISSDGWNDLGNDVEWHNTTEKKGISAGDLIASDNNYLHSAYLARIELTEDIQTINISIPEIDGIAHVYCNGRHLGNLGHLNSFYDIEIDPSCGYSAVSLTANSDHELNIIIFVTSDNLTPSPGILAFPSFENSLSEVRAIALSTAWIVIVVLLATIATVGGRILSKTFRDVRKFYFFCGLNLSFFLYFLIDGNYIIMNGLTKSLFTFVLFIACATMFYCFISSLFVDKELFETMPFLQIDAIIVCFVGIAIVCLVLLDINLFYSNYLYNSSLVFMIVTSCLCLGKVIFIHIEERNSTIGLCSAVTSIFFLSFMLSSNNQILNISSYSIFYILALFSIEFVFVTRYVNQYLILKNSASHMQYVIKEKTQNIQDINRSLLLTNKSLIENEEARKNIMSNVSHDLRTPIAAIRGYAELMLTTKDTMTEDMRIAFLQNIIRRSQQMERIVSDIVELSRMESSGSEFNFMDISLSELLDEIFSLFYQDTHDNGKTLKISLPEDDLLIIKADPRKLSRVFENLVSNAINYTGDSATIEIKAWRSGEDKPFDEQEIHVTVTDNGIGIPKSEIPMIFDRFYRAKNSGKNIKGTGLGLSIVKLIVDKHQAKISVDSILDVGTTFHIVFRASE